ncbi:MAG: hypothetical protein ACOX7F_03870 [Eubacteriales bacterium]|jgi:Zn-dependent protease
MTRKTGWISSRAESGWKFGMDPAALFLLCAFYIGDMLEVYLLGLVCALLHELGHLVGLVLCGGYLKEIRIHAFGVEIRTGGTRFMGYPQECFICAMGPFMNLLLLLAGWKWMALTGTEMALYFCGINLALLVINLLPARSLDGGRILRAALLQWCPYPVACGVCRAVEWLACGVVLSVGTAVLLLTGYNLSLLAVGVFLLWQMVVHPGTDGEKGIASGAAFGYNG